MLHEDARKTFREVSWGSHFRLQVVEENAACAKVLRLAPMLNRNKGSEGWALGGEWGAGRDKEGEVHRGRKFQAL